MYISASHFWHCGLILVQRPTLPPEHFLSTKRCLTHTHAGVCLIQANHVYQNKTSIIIVMKDRW